MSKWERAALVTLLIFIAIAAIGWGSEFMALIAVFNLLVGAVIGMVIFIENKATP